jgi:hypothetical protein
MEMFQLELMVGKFVRVWFPVVLSTGWCSSRLWLIVKFAPVVFLSECCIRLQWRRWCRSLSFFFQPQTLWIVLFFFRVRASYPLVVYRGVICGGVARIATVLGGKWQGCRPLSLRCSVNL